MQRQAIDYAGRSLHYTYNRMDYDKTHSRLIRIAVGVAIEKSLESYLRGQKIPFSACGRTHWRLKDVAEFVIKDQNVDIKGYHVYPKTGRNFPEWFLNAEGLVPQDQLYRSGSPQIYLQAFLVAPRHNESQQHRYVGIFPRGWSRRWPEARIIHLALAGKQKRPFDLTLCGEDVHVVGQPDSANGDIQETILVSPGKDSTPSQTPFSSLQYAATASLPECDVLVTVDRGKTHTLHTQDWFDLWLQQPCVYFTAWGSKQDYRETGKHLPKGTKTQVYFSTRTPNRSILIRNLRPISELLR